MKHPVDRPLIVVPLPPPPAPSHGTTARQGSAPDVEALVLSTPAPPPRLFFSVLAVCCPLGHVAHHLTIERRITLDVPAPVTDILVGFAIENIIVRPA